MEFFLVVLEKFWIPILATLATGIIKARLERKPKIIAFLSHASSVSLLGLPTPPPPAPAAAQPAAGGNAGAPAVVEPAPAAAAPAAVAAPPAAGQPPLAINTHSIVLRNVGKVTAYNVRVSHHQVPILGYQVQPTLAHRVVGIPAGGWEILLPTLVPNEAIQITYVYAPNITWGMIYSFIKSNDGAAATINVVPVQIPSATYRFFRALFVYSGIFALSYVIFLALQWLFLLQSSAT